MSEIQVPKCHCRTGEAGFAVPSARYVCGPVLALAQRRSPWPATPRSFHAFSAVQPGKGRHEAALFPIPGKTA
jgi:hypothetical protein